MPWLICRLQVAFNLGVGYAYAVGQVCVKNPCESLVLRELVVFIKIGLNRISTGASLGNEGDWTSQTNQGMRFGAIGVQV